MDAEKKVVNGSKVQRGGKALKYEKKGNEERSEGIRRHERRNEEKETGGTGEIRGQKLKPKKVEI